MIAGRCVELNEGENGAVSQCEGCSLARTLPCKSRPMEMRLERWLECCLTFVEFRVWNDLLVRKRFHFLFLILLQCGIL